jgi:hypothetical protein
MKPKPPTLLYSVNTELAYNIAIQHYGGLHYVWCSPIFSTRNQSPFQASPPPSSCPSDIYHSLAEEVRRGDAHSVKIASNRSALIDGARRKQRAGVITLDELGTIEAIALKAEVAAFRPLLYVIPYSGVSHLLKDIPVADRANPMSPEYRIEELPTDSFDVIALERN